MGIMITSKVIVAICVVTIIEKQLTSTSMGPWVEKKEDEICQLIIIKIAKTKSDRNSNRLLPVSVGLNCTEVCTKVIT